MPIPNLRMQTPTVSKLRKVHPKRFEKAIPVYRHVVREELATPLHPSDADELQWLLEQRKRASAEPSFAPDRRTRAPDRGPS